PAHRVGRAPVGIHTRGRENLPRRWLPERARLPVGRSCPPDIGEASFQDMQRPVTVDGQRAAALRFADPRVQGLLHVLLLFVLVQGTFAHSDLREHLAPLLGQKPSQLTPGRITYHLRRLRLHGLIERIPKSYRYRITANGLRTAIFYTRLYNRALR